MKKVKFFTELNVAANIAVLMCYVLTAVLMYNETAENNNYIFQVSFYLGLLGSIAVITIAAIVFSIIAARKFNGKETQSLQVILDICCIFSCLVFAFTITAFLIMLTNANGNTLNVDPYATIIIGGIWASIFSTVFAIIAAILLSKDKPKKH